MGRLFWKFFFFFWLAQLTAGVGVGLTFWLRDHAQERQQSVVDASPPARFQVGAAAATLRHGGVAALRALLEAQGRRPGPPVFVLDEQRRELLGRTIAPETQVRIGQLTGDERSAGSGHDPLHDGVEQVVASDGRTYVLFAPPSEHPAPQHPAGEAHNPSPPPSPHPHLPMPAVPLIAGVLVSLLFAALLAWYFATPIRSLRAAFEAAAGGRLGQRLAPEMGRRRDELADLGRDFDRMAQQLKNLMDGQRRLLHDVSHELRSPLARLQAAIGLAHQQPERADQLLARIELEAERMDRLVSELLTLSRLEAGMAGRLDDEVDLGELLDTLVEDARFEAQARGCRVDYAGPEETPLLRGNAELLHRALENVVRNAIKHSPPGGLVSIAVQANGAPERFCLRVLDSGEGVPEGDLQAIFAPFFRSEGFASPDGHGLGLAISRRVVELHGGTIAAANRSDGGLCVSIVLPRAPNASPAA